MNGPAVLIEQVADLKPLLPGFIVDAFEGQFEKRQIRGIVAAFTQLVCLPGLTNDIFDEKVGLAQWADHTPGELSGGQQQRVAIARAIVTEPDVLLADEPTGNLDTERSIEIMELLTDLNRRSGITVLMVTHEAEMADFARTIIHFRDGLVESVETGHKRAVDKKSLPFRGGVGGGEPGNSDD